MRMYQHTVLKEKHKVDEKDLRDEHKRRLIIENIHSVLNGEVSRLLGQGLQRLLNKEIEFKIIAYNIKRNVLILIYY